MDSFATAFTEVKNLVEKFKQCENHYISPYFNETESRIVKTDKDKTYYERKCDALDK